LLTHGTVQGWADLQRSDVERWLDARREEGLSPRSQYAELCDLRAFLKFVEQREHTVNPNLFRMAVPVCPAPLPKHLSETEYERLTEMVLMQTADDPLTATIERAWFLTLAHTGLRVNEMLDLHLGDLDFAGGRIIIAAPKNGKDRIAFMTPTLAETLMCYLVHRPKTDDDHL
jgi:site-specific recombinase XerD